jgi:PhzF family phenazine biosynthesis protein
MILPFFQVDAFAPRPLTGNPAAVMPLEEWLADDLLQAIAAENNLSETAFTVPLDGGDADYHLRWFTPVAEVDMCGHATIASGHVLLTGKRVRFATRSGLLTVTRAGEDRLELDLPAARLEEREEPDLCSALGLSNRPVQLADRCNDAAIVEVGSEAEVRALQPDFARLKSLPRMAVVTARGADSDIASRVFVPYLAIDEDPVTGSAHAALVPYWAPRLGKSHFSAVQVSQRGGLLDCRQDGDRVRLAGRCWTVIEGSFQL